MTPQKRTTRSSASGSPGFNLFSVEQGVEIGRQSAVEAERQLPMLRNRNVDRYLGKIVTRLAAHAPGARYPYGIKAVNDSSINAFALPGGPMYVNRGLFEAARSEAELAGVLAHEMAHVALRHGTHQASKAYLGQAGLGILGGLLGKNGGNTAQIVNAVGGPGLNAVFLKFGRDAEYQAVPRRRELRFDPGRTTRPGPRGTGIAAFWRERRPRAALRRAVCMEGKRSWTPTCSS
jgi:beta-barrel assembly-enhancing protease